MNEIPDAIHNVEKHLHQLRSFTTAVDDLQAWIDQTRDVLQHRHAQSATSPDEEDSIIVDPQVCQHSIRRINVFTLYYRAFESNAWKGYQIPSFELHLCSFLQMLPI